MTMTKKDFILIAEAIHTAKTSNGSDGPQVRWAIDDVAHVIANRLQEINPKFDRYKFLEACGFNRWNRKTSSVD